MNQSARESEHYSLSAKHWSVIQSSDLHRCMQRAIFASKVQNEIQRCTNCRPYCQLSDAPIRARVRALFAEHCSSTRSERRRLRARERAVPGACRGEPSPPRARERSPPYASERSPSRARAVPAQCEGHAQRCRVAERTAERKRYELSALPSAFSAPIRTRGRTRADAFSAPIRARGRTPRADERQPGRTRRWKRRVE